VSRYKRRQPAEIPLEDRLLTPAELGAIMRVEPRAIMMWAAAGKIRHVRTIGGHRRYYLADVLKWQRGEIPEGWTFTLRGKKQEAESNGSTD
jgi:excisionase family DNA binding protein